MLKFINSIATIEVNKALEAVQISLKSGGSIDCYVETLRIAASFANLHHISSYFLVKDEFEDITCRQFHAVIEDWLHLLEQHFNRKSSGKTKVAIRVNRDAFLELSKLRYQTQQTTPVSYYHVACDLFYADNKAHSFLISDVVHAPYLSI